MQVRGGFAVLSMGLPRIASAGHRGTDLKKYKEIDPNACHGGVGAM
jgi:hypothetical protein